MRFRRFYPKYKVIMKGGRAFLHRLSFPLSRGSIKVHFIVNDDTDEPHIHPWTFTSFLAIGAYKEHVNGELVRHLPFSIVRYDKEKRHKVQLYRLFGIRLPCLTVGYYSDKIQPWCHHQTLCEYCAPFGTCQDKAYWAARTLDEPSVVPDQFEIAAGRR